MLLPMNWLMCLGLYISVARGDRPQMPSKKLCNNCQSITGKLVLNMKIIQKTEHLLELNNREKCSWIVETYIFDKKASTLTIQKRWMGVTQVVKRSLQEISQLELKETEDTEDYKFYELRLLTNRGDRLSLGKSVYRKEQQKMADLIRDYLNARSHSGAL